MYVGHVSMLTLAFSGKHCGLTTSQLSCRLWSDFYCVITMFLFFCK